MIDITLIRENPELVKENIKKKFQDKKVSLVDKVAKLDAVWRKEKKAVDDLRSKRNKISESINQLMKGKKKGEAKKLIITAEHLFLVSHGLTYVNGSDEYRSVIHAAKAIEIVK